MDLTALTAWYAAHPVYTGILLFLLGLCVGSFLNVCVYRIPNKISVLTPPSHCPDCKARLKPLELIPVFSWIVLRGKCGHCGSRISPRYALVELLTGALFLLCWWRLPGIGALLPGLVLVSVLIACSFIDAEHTIIPNGLVIVGAAAGALSVLLTCHPNWKDALLGALAGGGPLFLIDVVSRMVLRRDGMGGGDVKLMAMVGLFLGWQHTLLALAVAVLLGGIAGAALLLAKKLKRGDYFPFGPFLAAGTVAALLFGGVMLQWYDAFNRMIAGWIAG